MGMLLKKLTNQWDFPKPRNLPMSHVITASLNSPQPLPGGMCWTRPRGVSSTFLVSRPIWSLSTHSGSHPLPCSFWCPWAWVFCCRCWYNLRLSPPPDLRFFACLWCPIIQAISLGPASGWSWPLCPFFQSCIWVLLLCPACLSSSDLIGHRTLTLACWKAFCVNLGAMMSRWQTGPGPVLSNPGPGALGSCLLRYKLGYMLKTLSDFNSPHWTSKTCNLIVPGGCSVPINNVGLEPMGLAGVRQAGELLAKMGIEGKGHHPQDWEHTGNSSGALWSLSSDSSSL